MQEQQQLRKKVQQFNSHQIVSPHQNSIADVQELLKKLSNLASIEETSQNLNAFLKLKRGHKTKKLQVSRCQSVETSKKKQNKFEQVTKSIKNIEPVKANKTEGVKTKEKNKEKSSQVGTKRQRVISRDKEKQFQKILSKKQMKINRKMKGNVMKEFILQTIRKAKAEGRCIIYHKGTDRFIIRQSTRISHQLPISEIIVSLSPSGGYFSLIDFDHHFDQNISNIIHIVRFLRQVLEFSLSYDIILLSFFMLFCHRIQEDDCGLIKNH